MKHVLALFLMVLGLGGAIASLGLPVAHAEGPRASLVKIEGAIQPSTARFLARAIEKAADDGSVLLIVTLNTPGGLYDSTRKMVESMLASPVPIVVYVSPQGARAASAGTFIAAAAHVAAMAPISNIGAATPVGAGGDLPDALESKAKKDAAALLRSIAEKRGRNAEALEATVLEATAYSASEALENGIIDLIASDLDDLMGQLDGRTVLLEKGSVDLKTEGLEVAKIEETLLEGLLGFLSNPTVIFLLLALGVLGVFLEFFVGAGLILPGVTGLVFLVLAFLGMGQMPVNWAGFALIVAAVVLFYFEIAVIPGTTVFGVLGGVSFAVGGFLLFGDFTLPGFKPQPIEAPSFGVNPWIIVGVAASIFAFFMLFVRDMMAARRSGTGEPTSPVSLVGELATVTTALDPRGTIRVAGEQWSALSDSGDEIPEGEEVMVLEAEGLTLKVFKAPDTLESSEGEESEGDSS
jgi:membrane-bound serine protease (ClpP class)